MASIRFSATATNGGEKLLDIIAEGQTEGEASSLSSRLSVRLGVEDGVLKGAGSVEVTAQAIGDASAETEVQVPEGLAPLIESWRDRIGEMTEDGLLVTETSETQFSFMNWDVDEGGMPSERQLPAVPQDGEGPLQVPLVPEELLPALLLPSGAIASDDLL
ncbi:hypothetical protein ACFOD4_16640 [Pseudoroseomonas globiformis]|uniref:Uncharacterized protein n=1 Tax=Teichococcus globiformis TaxID=2307229 RepID=A0ABV7G1Y2_9PROT